MISRALVAVLLMLTVAPLHGQNLPDSARADTSRSRPGHPVLVGTDTLILLRGDLGPHAAADRAAIASAQLRDLSGRSRAASDSVTAGMERGFPVVQVGGRTVVMILDDDALPDRTASETAAFVAERLAAGLTVMDGRTGAAALLVGIALSLLATAALLVFARGVRAGTRLARSVVIPGLRRRLGDVGVGGFTILRASQAARAADLLLEGARWALIGMGLYVYLTFVFGRFRVTQPWAEQLGSASLNFARDAGQTLLQVIPDLAIVVVIVLVTRSLTRLAGAFFTGVEDQSVTIEWLHPEVARPTRKLVTIGLWIFALVVMFPYLPGSDTDAFKGVSIFIGLVLSLGSSGVVGNGMSGLVLMYSRALKVGDVITVGDTTGEVIELGTLATRLQTNKNMVVTLPNSVMAGAEIRNLSRMAEVGVLAVPTEVGIGYDAPWRTVHRLLTEAALSVNGVLPDPAPFIRQKRLGDFAVTYELNIHVKEPMAIPRLLSEVHAAIQDAFNRAGIEIMSPVFEVGRPGPETTVLPPDRWGVERTP